MSTNETPKSPVIDEVKGTLVSLASQARTIFAGARDGLVSIQDVANELIASERPGPVKYGNRLLEALEKAEVSLDIEAFPEDLKQVWGKVRLIEAEATSELSKQLEEAVQESSDLQVMLSDIKSSNEKTQISFVRPISGIFPEFEEAQSDTFIVSNDPDLIKSRIRFIKDNSGVIGIAVVSLMKTDGTGLNTFYFSDYLELCDTVHGRKLVVDGTSDGVFVYRSVMQLAVGLADLLVSQFRGLDGDITNGNHRGDGLQFSSDVLEKVDADENAGEDLDDGHDEDLADPSADSAEQALEEFSIDEDLTEGGDTADGEDSLAIESPDGVAELADAFADALDPTDGDVSADADEFDQLVAAKSVA
jgi:hypothetical protein